jgi:hypothetical protein
MILLALGLLAAPDSLDFARAESLLARHDLPEARAIAEQLVAEDRNSERAHLLLGRVWLVWPITGRFEALHEFREAARLAPHDPEPLYLQSDVGFALGGDDGGTLARGALLRLFAVAPDYRDAWHRFEQVFQDPAIWRKADAALSRFPDDVNALAHRAELALRLQRPLLADSFAARVLARRPDDEAMRLLRAEAGFVAGRDSMGYAWYDSALAHVDADTAEAMWDAVWMIATPVEGARYDSTPPRARRLFFRDFWSPRDPNLVTAHNERIAEHFRRLVYVRRTFRLLHPLSSFFYSQGRQALSSHFVRQYIGQMAQRGCIGGDSLGLDTLTRFLPSGSRDGVLARSGLGPSPLSIDSTAGATAMRRAGFDARGLVWVRYGKPDTRANNLPDPSRPCENPLAGSGRAGYGLDVEGWLYNTPQGPLTIGFLRGTGPHADPTQPSGDYLFMPVTRRQVTSARQLLRTSRTSIPAPLAARVWVAFFKGGRFGSSDVYFKTAPDTATVVLWDSVGAPRAHATGSGLMAVRVPPGAYQLGVDVDSAGVLGRLRRALTVPRIAEGVLHVSSLVLASDTTLVGRDAVLAAAPADLVYAAGQPLAAYAEIYGLKADADDRNRYTVRYTFEPSRGLVGRALKGSGQITLTFTREAPAREVTLEQLGIDTKALSPGSYRVTLEVTDLVGGGSPRSVALDIQLR